MANDVLGNTYIGYQRITTTGTAVRLTIPAGAGSALLSIAGNPIRIGWDPSNLVTATTGHYLPVGTTLIENQLGHVSVIQDATLTGGILEVTYRD